LLRRMKPVRQVQVAELMVASNNYTKRFAQALLMGTSDDMRVQPPRQDRRDITPTQRASLAQETDMLLRKAKSVEATYGKNVLTLSVGLRYIEKLVLSQSVRNFLTARHPELFAEFQALIADFQATHDGGS